MVEGRCNCSSVKVTVSELPDTSIICYCANCRRQGGSIGTIVYILDKTEVSISDPKNALKDYLDSETSSGRTITRQFCSTCGSPIATLLEGNSPKIIVKGGLFDHIPRPSKKSFEQDEPAWMKVCDAQV